MSRKKCRHTVRKSEDVHVTVELANSPEAKRFLDELSSLIETGTYPCPVCGTLVQFSGVDLDFGGLRFRCPKEGCLYEGTWE